MVPDPPLSDAEFEWFCLSNDDIGIERTKDGVIEVTALNGGFTSMANAAITQQLRN
jgi:Uma2 family endonuclease